MTLEEAKEILKDYGGLAEGNINWVSRITGSCIEYVNYQAGTRDATLDGNFTSDELEAIAIIMRQK
ncbi:hypothetical protein HYZ97_04235 [Candidatus Pacearchaeota archaeon]|nr:hypothetical protein [Candidatus Pacearchaeota archaeon]